MIKYLYIFFFFQLITVKLASANTESTDICSLFFDKIENEVEDRKLYWSPQYTYEPIFGFVPKQIYDQKIDDWVLFRTSDNNIIVDENIYGTEAFDLLKKGDEILKYNDLDISNLTNDEVWEIVESNDQIKISIIRKQDIENDILEYTLNKREYTTTEISPIFRIKAFDNIDVKNSDYTIAYELEYDWWDDRLIEIARSAYTEFYGSIDDSIENKRNQIGVDIEEDSWVNGLECYEDFEIFNLNLWIADLDFTNIVKDDLENKKKTVFIYYDFFMDGYEQVNISVIEEGIATFHTKFNLKAFPFDSHKLEFKYADVVGQDFVSIADIDTNIMPITEDLKSKIPQWHLPQKYADLESFTYYVDKYDSYYEGVSTSFIIERNSSYYVFKVIAPIILILIICWSVFWLNLNQMESRLTVSIVCLLTLIAYNFVIDQDIPKLSYLTAMDQIILISYIFAAIPTILSILFSNIKNNKSLDIDFYQKNIRIFGPLLYFVTILFIMYANINNNPSSVGQMKAIFG